MCQRRLFAAVLLEKRGLREGVTNLPVIATTATEANAVQSAKKPQPLRSGSLPKANAVANAGSGPASSSSTRLHHLPNDAEEGGVWVCTGTLFCGIGQPAPVNSSAC
jgi:hypothetical protein